MSRRAPPATPTRMLPLPLRFIGVAITRKFQVYFTGPPNLERSLQASGAVRYPTWKFVIAICLLAADTLLNNNTLSRVTKVW